MLAFLKNKPTKTPSIPSEQSDLSNFIKKHEECHRESEDLGGLSDVSVIPSQLMIPGNISIPRVDLHTLILDFSTVSFVDISGVKGLKMVPHRNF